jgi:hypothetical protein
MNNYYKKNVFNSDLFLYNLKSTKLEITSHEFTAIIVEPRKHNALEFVLTNFIENLDNRWRFIIYHSESNKSFILNIISNEIFKNRKIDMILICRFNLSIAEYNKLLTYKNFYEIIPTETLLIFQTDSMILKQNKNLIYDFLNYDYVGAPWASGKVGNGGLSLRKKSKMLDILNLIQYNRNDNEDYYFSVRSNNLNIPSYENAKLFSIETQYNDISFGIHRVWERLDKEEYSRLIKIYPQIQVLKELQNYQDII